MATLLGSLGAREAIKALPASGAAPEFDLEAFRQRLPTAQIPREKKLRKELFRRMDTNRNGYLTLSELQVGLPWLLERGDVQPVLARSRCTVPVVDLKPAIKCAYNAARRVAPPDAKSSKAKLKKKRSAGKLSRARSNDELIDVREFHALLVAFRHYLELDILFHKLDNNNDRMLSWNEVNRPQLLALLEEWNISPEKAKSKFPDEWTSFMKFEDFAEWCIVRRFGTWDIPLELDENDPEETVKDAGGANAAIGRVLQAFRDWDVDGDGVISQEELTRVMIKLDPKFTPAMCQKIFKAADTNQDGKVDYAEFLRWLTA